MACAPLTSRLDLMIELDNSSGLPELKLLYVDVQPDNSNDSLCQFCCSLCQMGYSINLNVVMAEESKFDPLALLKHEKVEDSPPDVIKIESDDCTSEEEEAEEKEGTSNGDNFSPSKETRTKFKCADCPKQFAFQSTYALHQSVYHSIETRSCSVCAEEFFCDLQTFKKHVNEHREYKPRAPRARKPKPKGADVVCHLCAAEFDTRGELNRHLNECVEQESIPFKKASMKMKLFKEDYYPCGLCTIVFSSFGPLKKHLRIVHDRKFPCKECCKAFRNLNNLRQHEKEQHLRGEIFPCELCPKKYSRRPELTIHMKKHTGLGFYECVCGSKMLRIGDYNRHKAKCTFNNVKAEDTTSDHLIGLPWCTLTPVDTSLSLTNVEAADVEIKTEED